MKIESLETRRIRAREAKQLLDNPLLKEAFAAVAAHIEDQAQSCPLDDQVRAQRIILSKQLMQTLKRQIERRIEDGEVAEIQIAEIEKQRGLRIFRR
jgi:hypothetical protein